MLRTLFWIISITFATIGVDPSNTLARASTALPQTYGRRLNVSSTLNETLTPRTTTVITAQSGDTAFLPCQISLREEYGVSWVRRRDWHILAADSHVYSRDERVRIAFSDTPGEPTWTLLIKFIRKEDEGIYDCQVSTRRGVWSQAVELKVTEPQAVLVGADDIYVGVGSPFTITCVITNTLKPPEYVLWKLDSRTLNFGTEMGRAAQQAGGSSTGVAGGHTVTFDPGPPSVSRLIVHSAASQDSGRYTCQPSSGLPASTQVHVALGNEMAAIQAADAAGCSGGIRILSLLLSLTVYFLPALFLRFS